MNKQSTKNNGSRKSIQESSKITLWIPTRIDAIDYLFFLEQDVEFRTWENRNICRLASWSIRLQTILKTDEDILITPWNRGRGITLDSFSKLISEIRKMSFSANTWKKSR